MISAPGLYCEVSAEEYFADPCPTPSLNQSLIPYLLKKSPRHAAYHHPRTNPYGPARESGKAQWLGEAVHRIALGRGREISEVRYRDYSSSSAREDRDLAVSNGRIPVLSSDLVRARDMAAILKDLINQEFEGRSYVTEAMLCWREETAHGSIWCRGLIDAFCPDLMYGLDPKVLRTDATPEAFGPNAAKSGYDVQGRWYVRGLERLYPEMAGRVRFANLVMESAAPHGHAILTPDGPTETLADMQVRSAIELWGRCVNTRSWPSYPRAKQTYSTPPWHAQAVMYREYGGDE